MKLEKAIIYLDRQIEVNDYMGETYYFKALVNKVLNQNDQYLQNLQKAESYYRSGKNRIDTYTETVDKIYLSDILEELNTVANKDSKVHSQ